MDCIEGIVERITYQSDDGSGFVVAKIQEAQKNNLTAIIGNMGKINVGENLRLYGIWEENKKHGIQFKVSSYETLTPATLYGIEKYLGSGIIKGLGPKYASKIVAKFGMDTFYIIENEIEKLKEIEGIGKGMLKKIIDGWDKNKELKDVMVFLQGQKISATYASKIYKKYREKTIALVKENPYRLADDINGIGFKIADNIAHDFGIERDSPFRIEAFIIYRLEQLAGEGNVYYPLDALINDCTNDLDVDRQKIINAVDSLCSKERERVIIENLMSGVGKAVYLRRLFYSEYNSAIKLKKLLKESSTILQINSDKAIVDYQTESTMMLSPLQKQAIKKALENKVFVITGGPGTGKTTIIKCISKAFDKEGYGVSLAAPTGRASKRMEEATGMPAKTIHRLLEYSPSTNSNLRHKNNPLDTDLVIVDEFSMVDIIIFKQLIDAIPLNACFIMVGDVDQLPSVGPGSVLKDIIDSGIVPFIRLNEIHRQKKDSFIILNAHKVNNGEKIIIPSTQKDKAKLYDFYRIQQEDKEEIINLIVTLCKDRIPKRFNLDPIKDIQILTPMQMRELGVINLNNVLQKNLNDNVIQIERGRTTFKVGDKVMQIKNNYDKDVFNGDIGKIKLIDRKVRSVTVQYDNKFVNYEANELDEIELAYAISIHKSQGSEYKAIIIPVHTQHYIMLKRNLLYTAITRGKELVILVGTDKAINIAIKNSTVQSRYTMLSERLMRLSNEDINKNVYDLF